MSTAMGTRLWESGATPSTTTIISHDGPSPQNSPKIISAISGVHPWMEVTPKFVYRGSRVQRPHERIPISGTRHRMTSAHLPVGAQRAHGREPRWNAAAGPTLATFLIVCRLSLPQSTIFKWTPMLILTANEICVDVALPISIAAFNCALVATTSPACERGHPRGVQTLLVLHASSMIMNSMHDMELGPHISRGDAVILLYDAMIICWFSMCICATISSRRSMWWVVRALTVGDALCIIATAPVLYAVTDGDGSPAAFPPSRRMGHTVPNLASALVYSAILLAVAVCFSPARRHILHRGFVAMLSTVPISHVDKQKQSNSDLGSPFHVIKEELAKGVLHSHAPDLDEIPQGTSDFLSKRSIHSSRRYHKSPTRLRSRWASSTCLMLNAS